MPSHHTQDRHAPRRPLAVGMLLGLIALAGGCSIEEFRDPSELVDEPQVISIRATPPEARPGQTVTLDALVHWPIGGWEPVWLICLPEAGDALETCVKNHFPVDGQVPPCGGDLRVRLCTAPSVVSTQITVPPMLQIPPNFDYPVFVELVAANAELGWEGCANAAAEGDPTADCLLSLKTVTISVTGRPNRNPEIAELLMDGVVIDATATPDVGAPDTSLQGFEVLLTAVVDATSVDEMWPTDADPLAVELEVDWFTTCGTIDASRGDDDDRGRKGVRCDPPADTIGPGSCTAAEAAWEPAVPGDCTVHVVIRDGNGGVTFRSQSFTVGGLAPTSPQHDKRRMDCGCRADPRTAIPMLPLWLGILWWWIRRRRR